MLIIHHLGVSQSERIIWLCEELGVDYELRRYDRDQGGPAPAEYKALHPSGTAPVITDGDIILAETGAIFEYIMAKHGGGRLAVGPDEPEFANYLFWYHFANGSFLPRGIVQLIVGATGGPEASSFMDERVGEAFAMSETRLGEVPYFAGDRFTAADLMMVFPLTRMRLFAQRDLSSYPNIRAYLQRIGERPAYLAAMRKGDPDLPLQLD